MTVGCGATTTSSTPFGGRLLPPPGVLRAPTSYVDVEFATPAERDARKKDADAIAAKAAPLKAKVAAIDAPYRDRIAKAKRENLEQKYKDALAVPAEKRTAEQKKLAADTAPLLKVTWDEIIAALSPADREKREALREQVHELEARVPPPTAAAWAIKASEVGPQTFVLKRGDPKRKALAVGPGFPRVLVSAPRSRSRGWNSRSG